MTREQLVTLPPRYQKAVFAALSPSTRLQIWQEKLDSVLLMPWDSITKSKIIDLKQHLTIAEYTRDIHTPPSNNMLQYAEAWENDMLGNGRVDSLQFVILFCTFMTYEEIHTLVYHPEDLDIKWIETNEDIKNILKAPWGVGGGGSAAMSDCECKYDIYCNVFLSDDCATPSGGCGTVYNCGLTGTSACKGMCPESMD